MANRITHTLNMGMQAGKIRSYFPLSKLTFSQNGLSWKYNITPSPLSASYDIKLTYSKGTHPNVFVLNPKLELYPGKKYLPHVYDTDRQWLCIYYRKGKEWNSGLYIADTVIPWTCEWLLHYECWISTGIWHGGGIHNMSEAEKQRQGDIKENNADK